MSPVIEQICRMSKAKKNYCFFHYLFNRPSFRLWWYAVILNNSRPSSCPICLPSWKQQPEGCAYENNHQIKLNVVSAPYKNIDTLHAYLARELIKTQVCSAALIVLPPGVL